LRQLTLFVAAPVALGMTVARTHPAWIAQWRPRLVAAASGAIGVLLVATSWIAPGTALESPLNAMLFCGLFTLALLVAGLLLASFAPAEDRSVIIIHAVTRNIPVALLVGKAFVSPATMAGFATTYFLLEVTVLVGYFGFFDRAQRELSSDA